MLWEKKGLIFNSQNNFSWMVSHAAVPFADHMNGDLYRIYFASRDELNRSHTAYIVIDITNPTKILGISKNPVLSPGDLGTFDDSGAMPSWIVNSNGKKCLYYFGWNLGVTVPFHNSIGLAISRDGGNTFTKFSEGPIIDRNFHEPYYTAYSSVIIEDSIWKMWYLSCIGWKLVDGKPRNYCHIKYAESKDGIEWNRRGIICINFKFKTEYAISRPCVIKVNDTYKMWYSYRGVDETYKIGYAESDDGIQWERKDHLVGIDVSPEGWDSEMIEYPFVFSHKGTTYMLYNGNGYGKSGFGYAVLKHE